MKEKGESRAELLRTSSKPPVLVLKCMHAANPGLSISADGFYILIAIKSQTCEIRVDGVPFQGASASALAQLQLGAR